MELMKSDMEPIKPGEFELSVTASVVKSEAELLRLVPPVLRARDSRLYLSGGKRLVDLWLYGGRAILGHKSSNTVRELKNAAERGLFVPLPHFLEGRLLKALARLFPGEGPRRVFRIYSCGTSLKAALENAGFAVNGPLFDPAFTRAEKAEDRGVPPVSLWRPFLENEILSPVLIPVLPWPLSPSVLVLDESLEEVFPPGDLVPPVLLAPAARAVHDLAALQIECAKIRYSKIEKALSAPGCKWKKKSVYLSRASTDDWRELFGKFLEKGFLLPPSSREPAILPPDLSPGEEAGLAALLAD